MMLTGPEKALSLTFFYPEYEGKRTAPQLYVRDVLRRQQDLNDVCRRNTQQAQIRQKGGLIKRLPMQKPTQLAITSGYFRSTKMIHQSRSTKMNQKIIKEMAWPISNNRSAPRRSVLSTEHRKSSSLRKHQTAQCLIRGLVHPSGHARGRLFDSRSCLLGE